MAVAENKPKQVKIVQTNFQDVVFKVQLGVFKSKTEQDLRKKFETAGAQNLEFTKNDAGMTVVLTGNATDYETANNLKESIIQKGMKDAFVVVYSGEKKLPISDTSK